MAVKMLGDRLRPSTDELLGCLARTPAFRTQNRKSHNFSQGAL